MDEEKKTGKMIQLSSWETENMNRGLKYLIDGQLKSPDKMRDIPEAELKSVAWLTTWRKVNFED